MISIVEIAASRRLSSGPSAARRRHYPGMARDRRRSGELGRWRSAAIAVVLGRARHLVCALQCSSSSGRTTAFGTLSCAFGPGSGAMSLMGCPSTAMAGSQAPRSQQTNHRDRFNPPGTGKLPGRVARRAQRCPRLRATCLHLPSGARDHLPRHRYEPAVRLPRVRARRAGGQPGHRLRRRGQVLALVMRADNHGEGHPRPDGAACCPGTGCRRVPSGRSSPSACSAPRCSTANL